ncbi:MAG: methyltransferase domain-containing protein [Alphaproteobacteria bacterium]
MTSKSDSQYTDGIVSSMEEIFGKGFLSPGGSMEVVRAFRNIQVAGMSVLDWGCGLGGATMALVRDLDAAKVVGVDIDAGNLSRAAGNVADAGLQDRISLEHVEPGPLPLPAGSLDIVFTQAAMCHIEDKAAVFADFSRVLRPGGVVLCVDWMKGDATSDAYTDWDAILRREGLDFTFTTAGHHIDAMTSAGFEDVSVRNESKTLLTLARDCIGHIEHTGRSSLLKALGSEGYDRFLNRSVARALALADGGLIFGHLTGRKPS